MAAFKASVERGETPELGILRKQFIAEIKAVPDDERALQFAISTEDVDRDSDSIKVDGWKLSNYRKNPVVLWAHDYRSLPVAKATKVFVEESKLKAVDHFAERDVYPFADTVYQMVKGGYLSATSVGFAPIKFERLDPDSEDGRARRGGVNFTQQELLEHSVVPVPANANALVEARSVLRDADWQAYTHEIERLLGLAGSELPREQLERAYKAIAPRLVVTVPGLKRAKDADGDDDPEMSGCETARAVAEALAGFHQDAAEMHAAAAEQLAGKAAPDTTREQLAALAKDGWVTASLVCPKKAWKSKADAQKWITDHGFKADKTDETESAYRFRQRDPGDFARIRSVCINPGRDTPANMDACKVIALGGPLKEADVDPTVQREIDELLHPAAASASVALSVPEPGWARDLRQALERHADETAAARQAYAGSESKGVIGYKKTPLAPESTPWDAGKEVAAASVDDLRTMCTWYAGDGTKKGDYKLPHHHASGNHACVWRGVAAAAGRLASTSLPAADVPGVKKHLAGHYRDFGKDAPWKAAPETWEALCLALTSMKDAGDGDELSDERLAEALHLFGFALEAAALRGETDPAAAHDAEVQAAFDELLAPFLPAMVFLGEGVEPMTEEAVVAFIMGDLPRLTERAVQHALAAHTGRVPDYN